MNLNATILGQTISFFLFVWFCMKYIWPPINLAIETRQKEINESLINSKKAQDKLLYTEKKIHLKLEKARKKASIILNEANVQRGLILQEARKKSLEEKRKILLDAQSEIKIEIKNVHKNLHQEIINLSFFIAKKIIKKNIHIDDKQELLDELVLFLSKVKK